MENAVALTKVLGRYPTLRDWGHTLTLTLSHQDRVSDRAFEDYDPVYPPFFLNDAFGFDTGFSERPLLSSRLDYRIGDDESEIAAFVEVGGSFGTADRGLVRDDETANRLFVTATKAGGIGPFTGLARLAHRGRVGPAEPAEVVRAGHGVRRDALALRRLPRARRRARRAAERPPLLRLLRRRPRRLPRRRARICPSSSSPALRYDPTPRPARSLLAGTLALRFGVPTVPGLDAEWQAFLDPLQFEVFSGIGSLRRSGGVFLDAVADAGFGVRYDLPSFALLRGVVAQSDVLSGLRLAAKFPLWVSDPDRIGPDEEAFGFRWLVGVETGL